MYVCMSTPIAFSALRAAPSLSLACVYNFDTRWAPTSCCKQGKYMSATQNLALDRQVLNPAIAPLLCLRPSCCAGWRAHRLHRAPMTWCHQIGFPARRAGTLAQSFFASKDSSCLSRGSDSQRPIVPVICPIRKHAPSQDRTGSAPPTQIQGIMTYMCLSLHFPKRPGS